MIAAGHPEAVEIGLEVLKNGGNAIDAAVATSLALGVAEPYGSGPGGKGSLVYYDAATRRTWYVDGLDESGAAFDNESFFALSSLARQEGAQGVGVPGLVATLELAHREWGSQPWAQLVLPVADLAERGPEMLPGMQVFFERRLPRLRSHPETRAIYLRNDAVPPPGSRLSNPGLALTLRLLADQGAAGFYQGPIAEAIVAELQAGGSTLTLEDFAAYQARLGPPLTVDWNDYKVVTSPAPTKGGATVLLTLKVLEEANWRKEEGFSGGVNIDTWARALQQVYPVIEAHIADTPDARERWQRISEADFIDNLRSEALRLKSAAPAPAGSSNRNGSEETTHFVVADRYGNVVALTQSLSHHFGSGVMAPGTGVLLNNSLKNFSYYNQKGVNGGAPRKRPTSTIAPTLVLWGGSPVLALGLPGGQRIPTTTMQILLQHLAMDWDLGEAIAAPRVHLRRSFSGLPDSSVLELEEALPQASSAWMLENGWMLEPVKDTEYFGGVTAIEITPQGFVGWADWRRTNFAAGF